MFAELIIILLAILVLFLIDSFGTIFGLITCVIITYCSLYNSCVVLNKRSIVNGVGKLWGTVSFCIRTKKQVCALYERMFSSEKKIVTSPLSNADFCGNGLTLENEINTLVVNISQYYIQSWYGKISDNDDFLISLNSSIKHTLTSLCTTVVNVDKKKVSFIMMQVYLHFVSHFLEEQKKCEVFKKEKFKMKHWAMKDNMTEWCYLQSLVSALLDEFCPSDCEKTLHSKKSPLLHTIVVEILTQNIIQPLVRLLSDPSFLNLILLKVLKSFETSGNNFKNSSDNMNQSSSVLPKESNLTYSPVILLSNEIGEPDEFVFENSSTEIFIPELLNGNGSVQESSSETPKHFFVKGYNRTPGNCMSLASIGLKSSSNANIFDQEFSNLQNQHFNKGAGDISIKRSRSADYIRQIPQFKALNERDYSIVLQSKNNKMLVALKNDSSSCIEQAEEAIEVEVPILFTDVKITDTFQEHEDGLPYTRYCIEYTGVFHDTGQTSNVPQYVQQVVTIRRRFKEFVALQSSLESNPSLKSHLKEIRWEQQPIYKISEFCANAIKAPSKWLLPFSNLDKKHIAERKIFLENYLNQLCSLSPIAQSSELQEFLAYGKDTNLFGRKNAEISVPRIDKMLVRGVKGAFDMIKTALPNSPLDDENLPLIPKSSFENVNPIVKFQEHLLDYSNREPEIKEHIINFMENSALNDSFGDVTCNERASKGTSLLRNIQSLEATECCNCPELYGSHFLSEKCPFGSTAMELIALCFELNKSNLGEFFTIVKLLVSPCVDVFLVNKLENISEEDLSTLLHMLHTYLWPDEGSTPDQLIRLENPVILDTILQHIEVMFSHTYFNINNALKQSVLKKINLFLSSIQHQEINKCLLFHIFDVIIEATCHVNL